MEESESISRAPGYYHWVLVTLLLLLLLLLILLLLSLFINLFVYLSNFIINEFLLTKVNKKLFII